MFSATNNMLIVKSMYYDKGIGNSDIKLMTGGVSVKNKFFTNELVRFANIVLTPAYIKKLTLFVVKNSQVGGL